MSGSNSVETLLRHGYIGEIDRHLAALIADLTGGKDEDAPLAAALASRYSRDGHICIDLKEIAGRHWPEVPEPDSDSLLLPEREAWLAQLAASPAVAGPESAAGRPLVLDAAGRLYLYRMWRRERSVAARLRALAGRESSEPAGLQAAARRIVRGRPAQRLAANGGPCRGQSPIVLHFRRPRHRQDHHGRQDRAGADARGSGHGKRYRLRGPHGQGRRPLAGGDPGVPARDAWGRQSARRTRRGSRHIASLADERRSRDRNRQGAHNRRSLDGRYRTHEPGDASPVGQGAADSAR